MSGIVTRNQHIERVHTSIEEDADERLAVCGRTISCGLVRHLEVEQHVHYRDRADAGTTGFAKKTAAAQALRGSGMFFHHLISSPPLLAKRE